MCRMSKMAGNLHRLSMKAAVDVVTTSHFKMMADVPLVGWDVAFTETGISHSTL